MNMIDTVKMMTSEDYKERFRAEYFQLLNRYNNLSLMVEKWDRGLIDFVPKTPRSLYDLQLKSMRDYIAVLEARAVIEGIFLEGRRNA